MVEQAQDLARLSPVDREYMPTLGPQKYEPTRRYVEETATLSLADRAQGRRRGARGVREGEGRQRRLSPGPGDGRRGGDEERQFQLRAQHDRQPRHDRPHARRRGIGILPAQPHRRPPRRHAARLPRGHPAGAGVARRADARSRQLSGDPRGSGGRRPHLRVLVELRRAVGGGRPQRVRRARRTDEGRREGVRRADQHPERSLA